MWIPIQQRHVVDRNVAFYKTGVPDFLEKLSIRVKAVKVEV